MPHASAPTPRAAIPVALLLAGAACGEVPTAPGVVAPPAPPAPAATLSQTARAYLEELVGVMERNSVRRLAIDWPAFRARVLAAAPTAQSVADTRPAIQEALAMLGDGHSTFSPTSGLPLNVPTRTCAAPAAPAPDSLPATVGYVRVGAFAGGGEVATAFARMLQDSIRAHDRAGLAGWIVDLRGNTGGNMYPMLVGVGPILGEGTAGHFVDAAGAMKVWGYRDGAALVDGRVQEAVGVPYRLRREHPRVAVLTDGRVASSGEAVAIAFRHRPDTRSFGTATCGLSTGNAPFFLSDGAVLNLTVSVMADRTRRAYGDRVLPDEEVADPAEAVRRAVAWLTGGDR